MLATVLMQQSRTHSVVHWGISLTGQVNGEQGSADFALCCDRASPAAEALPVLGKGKKRVQKPKLTFEVLQVRV